jgi:hypothetical protein
LSYRDSIGGNSRGRNDNNNNNPIKGGEKHNKEVNHDNVGRRKGGGRDR